ncbi:MAG: hypothetical protein NVSMB25_08890 [Thermoleophilaceae bacterium]
MGFSDSHHFRKLVAGSCMVIGPLLALGSFVVSPRIDGDTANQIAQISQHQDRFLVSMLLALAAVPLVTVAALGLMHMLRERMVGYGHLGGGLALFGLLATMAQLGSQLTLWPMVRDGSRAANISVWHAVTHEAATMIPLYIVPLVAALGFVTLALGVYRAHAVDWWMAALLALGAAGIALAIPLASIALGIVGAALFLVGSGSIGLIVVSESDADWVHTPEHRGFRTAIGMR